MTAVVVCCCSMVEIKHLSCCCCFILCSVPSLFRKIDSLKSEAAGFLHAVENIYLYEKDTGRGTGGFFFFFLSLSYAGQ